MAKLSIRGSVHIEGDQNGFRHVEPPTLTVGYTPDATYIKIGLCVNNPDNGILTNTCEAIEFGGERMYFSCHLSYRHDLTERWIKISRRKFPVRHYGTWVGNWCWNGCLVTPETAADIANYLQTLKYISIEQGDERLWDKWENKQTFTASDFIND